MATPHTKPCARHAPPNACLSVPYLSPFVPFLLFLVLFVSFVVKGLFSDHAIHLALDGIFTRSAHTLTPS